MNNDKTTNHDFIIPYYEDNSRVSNSALGWFIKGGPAYYKGMLDGKLDGLSGSFLDTGTMVHMYILQPEEFWNEYVVLNFETPKSEQQRTFCKNYVSSNEFENNLRVIDAMKLSYSTANKSDDKLLLDGLEMCKKFGSYIEYLQNLKKDKKIISWSDLNMLKAMKSNLESHKAASKLFFNLPKHVEQLNEFHINWEFPKAYHDVNLPCKSLIDRVLIDHAEKKIILIDLKTTSDINNFNESIKKYSYQRQLAWYWLAIMWYFKNVLDLDFQEYNQETYIVTVQTNNGFPVKVIKFNDDHISSQEKIITNTVSNICWHTQNNLWEYNKEYYEGEGFEYFSEV